MQLVLKNYQKLLKKIQQTIAQAQENIVRNVNREKVRMSWEVGREVELHLKENKRAGYGDELIKKLAEDTGIERSALYKMCAFYKAYPKLPSEEKTLSWSHYRSLIAVKDQETRARLENLVVEKSIGSNRLREEIAAVKNPKKIFKKSEEKIPQLRVRRGKLFTYELSKDGEIDLGFNIFLDRETSFVIASAARQSTCDEDELDCFAALAMTEVKKSDYTYIAKLERVVDGDTIHVKLDLGFGVKHREILRLAKIDAAAADTKEGKKATAALKKIVKDLKFLIVKTNKTDIYGRYIADVFFDPNQSDPNKVAKDGKYLNQTLLDLGLVGVY